MVGFTTKVYSLANVSINKQPVSPAWSNTCAEFLFENRDRALSVIVQLLTRWSIVYEEGNLSTSGDEFCFPQVYKLGSVSQIL